MFEDGSSKVTKAKKRFGHGGNYSIKEVTYTCKQKTLMFGYACLAMPFSIGSLASQVNPGLPIP